MADRDGGSSDPNLRQEGSYPLLFSVARHGGSFDPNHASLVIDVAPSTSIDLPAHALTSASFDGALTHANKSAAIPNQPQTPKRKPLPVPPSAAPTPNTGVSDQNTQPGPVYLGNMREPYQQHSVFQPPTSYSPYNPSLNLDAPYNVPSAPLTGEEVVDTSGKPTFNQLQIELPDGFRVRLLEFYHIFEGRHSGRTCRPTQERSLKADIWSWRYPSRGGGFCSNSRTVGASGSQMLSSCQNVFTKSSKDSAIEISPAVLSTKPAEDRHLHPMDGKLRKLIVASSDEIYEAPGTSTWRRTYVRNVAPWNVRIAAWVIDFHHDPDSWKALFYMLLRALVANIALQIAFYIKSYKLSTKETALWIPQGEYASVLIEYNGNAKVWSNHLENRLQDRLHHVLKPRSLCFLGDQQGMDIRSVEDWENTDGKLKSLSYVFVAYSAEQLKHSISNEHVYRTSDVLQGVNSLVIAVGQSSTTIGQASMNDLLHQ
ncbi:hypothetical protein SUNI508_13683 [Seiridium unicorne]|uniref:Uncharacterized protein n=1 Tax=Seiridium unicorne TaxID=138068 RepID=A0ABR2VBR3_9PEZI